VRLYELGKIYLPGGPDGLADERKYLTLGTYGDGADFFRLKGVVEAVLNAVRAENVRFEADKTNPSYHPGRCAKVYAGDLLIGTMGQIHPLVTRNYGVDTELYCAELSLAELMAARGAEPTYVPLPRFPAVMRDIAVVCDESVTVGALTDCIRRSARGLLKEAALFDVYRGPGIVPGKKSVAFNLTLRSDDRSLTSEDADADVAAILDALRTELGAILR
jgi:phenylalanyl-tRNA synthetase beta chain